MLANLPPLHHIMLGDVLGSLLGVLAFAAVLYLPGYLLAFATDLFGFRAMDFAARSLWAVACSFSVAPIAAYLVGRTAGLRGVLWLFSLLGVAGLALLSQRRGRAAWPRRERLITALLVCSWIAFVLCMLIDVQVRGKLYFSVVMADQSYRIAFTDAVVRTGVPPANPLYFAGSPAPMAYYYFWYILCAAVVKLAHISPRQAFIASSIWAGFGLLVLVQLYTRHFFRWERKQRWIASGLLLITGADLVPALGQAVLQPALNGDSEWWSVDPIDAWPDSLLWVPHHVAAVLCCLSAFLFLWRTMEPLHRRGRLLAIVLAATAFGSASGLSVYVAFGFALLMLAWLARLFVLRLPDRVAMWRRTLAASLLAAVLLAPFALELVRSLGPHPAGTGNAGTTPKQHLFSFSVRRMIDSELVTGLPAFTALNHAHPVLLDGTIRLLLLIPGLAMELGLYGAVLLLLLIRPSRDPSPSKVARDTALFLTVCGLITTVFLSSSVITNNDFGYRAVMLPQFFLLLLTADILGSWWLPGQAAAVVATPGRVKLLGSLLALGAAGTIYWAGTLRLWLPIEATRVRNGFSHLPEDNLQIREAFAALARVAPGDAVVAFRPIDPTMDRQREVMAPNEFYQRMLVMDAGRQLLNAEGKCATHFGGDPRPCPEIVKATAALYASPAPDAAWARGYCSRFGVQYLVISAWDPNWGTKDGWPVTLPAIAREPDIRILGCR